MIFFNQFFINSTKQRETVKIRFERWLWILRNDQTIKEKTVICSITNQSTMSNINKTLYIATHVFYIHTMYIQLPLLFKNKKWSTNTGGHSKNTN